MHLTAEGNKYAAFRKNKVEEVLYFFLLEGTIDDLADKKSKLREQRPTET